MFKKILLGLAVVLVLFLGYVATRPADFKIARSASIAAPPAKVHAVVNNLRKWNDWSPWAKMDPAMKTTYSGPESGVGAATAWAGNSQVGEGKMTITKSTPGQLVQMELVFLKPMAATNTVDFSLKPEGKGTQIEWSMTGRHNFVGKVFSTLMDMDKMVGADFEKGLATLKAMLEAPAKK
jgi:hypothetical protein